VSREDLERIEPQDPGASGGDPFLAICGTARQDAFCDQYVAFLVGSGPPSSGRNGP
jgi:hypothetical protein